MSEQTQTEEIEPWLRRVHAAFLGMDKGRTPPEGLSSFRIAKNQIASHGLKFSDVFLPAKREYLEECDRLKEENSSLKEALIAWENEIKKRKNELHKLSQKQWQFGEESNALELEAYEICCEYFRLVGRQPPPPPVLREMKQPEPKENKQKKKVSPALKMPKAPPLLDEIQKLFIEFDSPHPGVSERAYKKLRDVLSAEGVLVSDVVIPKPKGYAKNTENIATTLFKHIVLKASLSDNMAELKETYDEIRDKIKFVDADLYDLEGRLQGAKHDISLWNKKLREEKKKAASSTPSSQQQPPVQPTPRPVPQPTPQATPRPQPPQTPPQHPGPTRVVTPPRQPTGPTVRTPPNPSTGPAVQTPNQPQAPRLVKKRKSIWTWPFRKPMSAIALSCVLVFGGGYMIKKITGIDLSYPVGWSELYAKIHGGFIPLPSPVPRPFVPTTPRYRDHYVAYDPVSLWDDVVSGKGRRRIDSLPFGSRLQVELPVGQEEIRPTDTWVHVRLPGGRDGFVLGKQLSRTEPMHRPNISGIEEKEEQSPPPETTTEPQQAKDSAAPYKRAPITAYVCATKILKGTVAGSTIYIGSTTPIKACTGFYAVNGGKDTKLSFCNYSDGHDEYAYAKVFLVDQNNETLWVPYDAISLERSTCTQTSTIKGAHPTPK